MPHFEMSYLDSEGIDDAPTWTELGNYRRRGPFDEGDDGDYDEGYAFSFRQKFNRRTYIVVELYHLRNFQVVKSIGMFAKKWGDGCLLRYDVFDLKDLACSTRVEFEEIGWFFKKHYLSAVWFPLRKYSFSRYHKTVTPGEFEEWRSAQSNPPECWLSKSNSEGMINCHLEESFMDPPLHLGLRLSVPLDDQGTSRDFQNFIAEVGKRIELCEDYRRSDKALETLPGPLRHKGDRSEQSTNTEVDEPERNGSMTREREILSEMAQAQRDEEERPELNFQGIDDIRQSSKELGYELTPVPKDGSTFESMQISLDTTAGRVDMDGKWPLEDVCCPYCEATGECSHLVALVDAVHCSLIGRLQGIEGEFVRRISAAFLPLLRGGNTEREWASKDVQDLWIGAESQWSSTDDEIDIDEMALYRLILNTLNEFAEYSGYVEQNEERTVESDYSVFHDEEPTWVMNEIIKYLSTLLIPPEIEGPSITGGYCGPLVRLVSPDGLAIYVNPDEYEPPKS